MHQKKKIMDAEVGEKRQYERKSFKESNLITFMTREIWLQEQIYAWFEQVCTIIAYLVCLFMIA